MYLDMPPFIPRCFRPMLQRLRLARENYEASVFFYSKGPSSLRIGQDGRRPWAHGPAPCRGQFGSHAATAKSPGEMLFRIDQVCPKDPHPRPLLRKPDGEGATLPRALSAYHARAPENWPL